MQPEQTLRKRIEKKKERQFKGVRRKKANGREKKYTVVFFLDKKEWRESIGLDWE